MLNEQQLNQAAKTLDNAQPVMATEKQVIDHCLTVLFTNMRKDKEYFEKLVFPFLGIHYKEDQSSILEYLASIKK